MPIKNLSLPNFPNFNKFLNRGNNRSSRPEIFLKKGVLRNFAKFTGNHLCQRLFFNKVAGLRLIFDEVAGLRPATLLKKSLWHRYFPVNFAKFLRTPFLQSTSRRLILDLINYFLLDIGLSTYFL